MLRNILVIAKKIIAFSLVLIQHIGMSKILNEVIRLSKVIAISFLIIGNLSFKMLGLFL